MTRVLERRYFGDGEPVEFRDSVDGRNPIATGYAAVFDRRSLELRDKQGRAFVETIDPAAFNNTLKLTQRKQADVLALWNHDTRHLLGRVSSGTLQLSVDEVGLRYEVELPDTTTGRDVAELLRRGDIRGSSFGFRAINPTWSDDDGVLMRRITEAALVDTSPVTSPAYPDTDAGLRSVALAVGRDPAEVRAALEQRRLPSLVFPPQEEDETPPDETQDERRAEPTPASHRRLSWAY